MKTRKFLCLFVMALTVFLFSGCGGTRALFVDDSTPTPTDESLEPTVDIDNAETAEKIVDVFQVFDPDIPDNVEVTPLPASAVGEEREASDLSTEDLNAINYDSSIVSVLPLITVEKAAIYVCAVDVSPLNAGDVMNVYVTQSSSANSSSLRASDGEEPNDEEPDGVGYEYDGYANGEEPDSDVYDDSPMPIAMRYMYVFLDDNGNVITRVPENKHVNLAAYLAPGIVYSQVITTPKEVEPESPDVEPTSPDVEPTSPDVTPESPDVEPVAPVTSPDVTPEPVTSPDVPAPVQSNDNTPSNPSDNDNGNTTPVIPIPPDNSDEHIVPDTSPDVVPEPEPASSDVEPSTDSGDITPDAPTPPESGDNTPDVPTPPESGDNAPDVPTPPESGDNTPDEPTPPESSDITPSDDVISDDVASEDVDPGDVISDDVVSDDVISDDVTSDDINSDDTDSDDVMGDTFTSTTAFENALTVDNSTESYNNITVTKTGDASGQSEAYDWYGTNAGILAKNGANLTITGSKTTITTNAVGGNAVFAYGGNSSMNTNNQGDGTKITISDATITTSSHNSGGIMVTGGGEIEANNLTITTYDGSSAAIRSDRGGGYIDVTGGTYTTNGQGSPAIYSTAEINVVDADLTSNVSQVVVIEGGNSVELTDARLNANHNTFNGNDSSYQAILIYQSMSGDASEGGSSFMMTDGSLVNANGDIFCVTNTTCTIDLSGASITNNDDSGYFLRAAAGNWGSSGSNGGKVTLNADGQTIDGDMLVDSDSSLTLNMTNSAAFNEAINSSAQTGTVNVVIDSTSTWTLTGNTYVTSLTNNGTIDTNGYNLYVNGTAYSAAN